jgi:biofilm protein TabA
MKTSHLTAVILLFMLPVNLCLAQQWTTASAKKWTKSREWANGLTIKPSPSVNYVEFAKQYHLNKTMWDKAITFLNNKKLDTLKPGKYMIDGDNVYAMISEGPTKDLDKSAWESHKNYIDLHYVIRGKEKIGVAPVATATVTVPYDASKDIANYSAAGKFYDAVPGEFFLFFPTDAHRPGIKVDGVDSDKKLVIKIKYFSSNP